MPKRCINSGVTANQVTWFACAISVALGAWLTINSHHHALFLLLPIWFLVRMALNAIDGMLAREFGQRSALGAYLNELADVVSDAALYLPFAFLTGVEPSAVLLVIWLACVAELAGVLGLVVGAGRRYDGPMEKSDRALVFGVLGLIVGAGVTPDIWITGVMTVAAALIAITIVNRVRRGIAAASEPRHKH